MKKSENRILGGMILSWINIIITAVINIAVLGVDTFARSNFPLLSTNCKIRLGEFIERLEVLFMHYLVIGGFFKIFLYFYAAVTGIDDIFKFKNHRKIAFQIGFII
ncbi:spore germination protein [Neobacillus pocheonensis]|uniref:Spore germination protein n=1 Tax=Neobacillus pocheonensis TaxID=363869 RepID=A0ABT0WGG1_9BACI|nr:spore germination protein [Neobacillus pocheonensis]